MTAQQWLAAPEAGFLASKRDRSNPPRRNFEWPDGHLMEGQQRVVETQRVGGHDLQRRGLDATTSRRYGGWREVVNSDAAAKNGPLVSSVRRTANNAIVNNSSFGGIGGHPGPQAMAAAQNYRASIDFTATVGTIGGQMVDLANNKRNELYSMLREEVLGHLKQKEVSKDTIMGMKRQKKEHQKEI